jgi:two-component system LytT family response regulator
MNKPENAAKIKAIIVDDEELARKVILKYLEAFPQVEVVAECENGFVGLKAIGEHQPHLLFLDIQMPKINGFELLELLDEKPLIIFSTAHDNFAIRAFEQNAVDYLLKPYSQTRFNAAVSKALEKAGTPKIFQKNISSLSDQLAETTEIMNRVVVKTGSRVDVIPVSDIEYFEASDDYVEIHTRKERFIKQKTLKFFEDHLDPELFLRVHRSFIVAIHQISKLEPYSKDSFVLILKNGKGISVSKNGLVKLRQALKF